MTTSLLKSHHKTKTTTYNIYMHKNVNTATYTYAGCQLQYENKILPLKVSTANKRTTSGKTTESETQKLKLSTALSKNNG